ncbi:pentapeptide repeat-containing protein [Actinoplanes sp. NEAU-A12]|uniref:Pentapeptide repeat-containing protein n=1 Tax=Actinoplanes sandaracinus TaxID=3045177 RepID=A0ABT6X1T4_9ACTN|nr:pentapeptide repeat-containing protein [Actinoplanes sandaracinus]MDI6105973.1 pentapeptide repeat-containing protein [Actinoplanes sandaracinus]
MTASLGAPFFSSEGFTALVVAIIGAWATFVVGVLNYRRQGQVLRLQREYQGRQNELAFSAQVTDRFTRAIGQLGSESTHVRMGGIFAVERIARDSPDDRQHIVDTLAAFVRGRLPVTSVGNGGYVPIMQLRAPDVQAALTVLCRSPLADERVSSLQPGLLDLSRTDLRRANLRGARLDAVNLWGARLEGADLRGAHLVDSILKNANVGRFDTGNEAFLRGADLSFADLTGAQTDGINNLDMAVTDGVIGLHR